MPAQGSQFSLTESLARTNTRLHDLGCALGQAKRVDATGLPAGAAALGLCRLLRERPQPWLVVAPDPGTANRLSAALGFFQGQAGPSHVLTFPYVEVSPFHDVMGDRRASMQRLGVLFHLAQGMPQRFVVTSAPALLRRCMPVTALRRRCIHVQSEEAVDRDALLTALATGGYLRVPVVEDAGTFAVRGGLIDVFPPLATFPIRIDLDDELVYSLKRFDPEDQRSLGEVSEVWIHPVREAVAEPDELDAVLERISDACDAIDLPTSQRRAVLEDIRSGRAFLGIERYVPAFHAQLQSLWSYLPDKTQVAVFDPAGVARAVERELDRVQQQREAALEARQPAFPLHAHYLTAEQLADSLRDRSLLNLHRMLVAGEPGEEGPLSFIGTASHKRSLDLGASDQSELKALHASSARHGPKTEPLAPLIQRARAWLDEGLQVLFSARSLTQAERMTSLLRNYGLPVLETLERFEPEIMDEPPVGQARVVTGPLEDGFLFPSEGVVCVAEEEVFGERRQRRVSRDSKRANARAFVGDLRELSVGDHVVHATHGVGRYVGLARKTVPLSRTETLQGMQPLSVEVLVVEYAGQDRLLLPVTRLNQIEKHAGKEGAQPKLDRLGGQSFSRVKARARRAARQLADDLLKLYAERAAHERPALPPTDLLYTEFEASFPFEETPDQAQAIDEVMGDLERAQPMDRVVCGDVGFGKTEVALRAAFRMAMNRRQVAVLCPTTVLAQQHYLTFRQRLDPYPLQVSVLSRFVPKKEQSARVRALKDGTCDVIVGTHRLLSKDIHFKHLGLLVVDEEQRFGVAHKERIKSLRKQVDVLTLSATPIPRTLQMAVGGMRDLSLITTAPVDRRAVRTFVTRWDDRVIRAAMEQELNRAGQVFFVHNRIETLYERAARLQQLVPKARIAVAHGQLHERTLELLVTDFVDGRYDVLCSTAIVENGLDIPRANTMLIDRADLFGLAQLYQLRGRVGRSRERAYCYLISPAPNRMTDEARTRIETLERFSELGSGFRVASLDMQQRGAGDLLGADQSGSVGAVGLDMFVQMLQEAVAELRGQPLRHDIDPELTLDSDAYLPEDYVDDVGVRLSLYKRLAGAHDEQVVAELADEMEDRFGPPPEPALALVRAMRLRPGLRALRVLGCEAYRSRVTLHFREDTPLTPTTLLARVAENTSWRLSPDMKLTCRFGADVRGDAIERALGVLRELQTMCGEALRQTGDASA